MRDPHRCCPGLLDPHRDIGRYPHLSLIEVALNREAHICFEFAACVACATLFAAITATICVAPTAWVPAAIALVAVGESGAAVRGLVVRMETETIACAGNRFRIVQVVAPWHWVRALIVQWQLLGKRAGDVIAQPKPTARGARVGFLRGADRERANAQRQHVARSFGPCQVLVYLREVPAKKDPICHPKEAA